jgi:hypothetical protein
MRMILQQYAVGELLIQSLNLNKMFNTVSFIHVHAEQIYIYMDQLLLHYKLLPSVRTECCYKRMSSGTPKIFFFMCSKTCEARHLSSSPVLICWTVMEVVKWYYLTRDQPPLTLPPAYVQLLAFHAMVLYTLVTSLCCPQRKVTNFLYKSIQIKTSPTTCPFYVPAKHPFCISNSHNQVQHILVLMISWQYSAFPLDLCHFIMFCDQLFLAGCLCKWRDICIFQAKPRHIHNHVFILCHSYSKNLCTMQ